MTPLHRLFVALALVSLAMGCSKTRQEPAPADTPAQNVDAQNPQTTPPDAGAPQAVAANPADTIPTDGNSLPASDTNPAAQPQMPDAGAANPNRQKFKNTKIWPKAPDPAEGKKCETGNCLCGKGHCAKNAWCLNDKCYCLGFAELPFKHDDIYIQTEDFGKFTCESMDYSVIFGCNEKYAYLKQMGDDEEDSENVCTSDNGIDVETSNFYADSKLKKEVGDSELLELCGRKSAEAFKRDYSAFERFAKELPKRVLTEECKEEVERGDALYGSLNEDCLMNSKLEPERCEIRYACDAWYIPRQYRDQYVCEFEVGSNAGMGYEDSYFYPKAKGLRCIADTGCVCTNVKIDKGEYCNSVPEYGYPLDGEAVASKTGDRTFTDNSSLKWNETKETFKKPYYHGNDNIDLAEGFARQMSSVPREYPRKYGECTTTQAKISNALSVALVQCEILDDKGEYEEESCDADGYTGYPIGLFLNIRDHETDKVDVHWIGDVYSDCGNIDFWNESFEYEIHNAYTESLGDTAAIHVILSKKTSGSDCDHERSVDGLDCRGENAEIEDRHYIFAGEDHRQIGYYPERLLIKSVNGCGERGCGEWLKAELYEGKLALNQNTWQYETKHRRMELQFSTKEERDKAQNAALKYSEYIPKVDSKYEKYLKYAKKDLTFDEDVLKPFLKDEPGKVLKGALGKDIFEIRRSDIK